MSIDDFNGVVSCDGSGAIAVAGCESRRLEVPYLSMKICIFGVHWALEVTGGYILAFGGVGMVFRYRT